MSDKTTKYELPNFGGWITIEEQEWAVNDPNSLTPGPETVYKVTLDGSFSTVLTEKRKQDLKDWSMPGERYASFMIQNLIRGEITKAFEEHAKNE